MSRSCMISTEDDMDQIPSRQELLAKIMSIVGELRRLRETDHLHREVLWACRDCESSEVYSELDNPEALRDYFNEKKEFVEKALQDFDQLGERYRALHPSARSLPCYVECGYLLDERTLYEGLLRIVNQALENIAQYEQLRRELNAALDQAIQRPLTHEEVDQVFQSLGDSLLGINRGSLFNNNGVSQEEDDSQSQVFPSLGN